LSKLKHLDRDDNSTISAKDFPESLNELVNRESQNKGDAERFQTGIQQNGSRPLFLTEAYGNSRPGERERQR